MPDFRFPTYRLPIYHTSDPTKLKGVKPMSRKKLRQLMPGNHANLTTSALADSHGRRPGPGRFRNRLKDNLERLELAAKAKQGSITLLGRLRELLKKPVPTHNQPQRTRIMGRKT